MNALYFSFATQQNSEGLVGCVKDFERAMVGRLYGLSNSVGWQENVSALLEFRINVGSRWLRAKWEWKLLEIHASSVVDDDDQDEVGVMICRQAQQYMCRGPTF